MPERILIVDDDRALCEAIQAKLRRAGWEADWRLSAVEAQQTIEHDSYDVVLADMNMPGRSGLELCDWIATSRPELPVVVITAFGSLESAVAAIRARAYDFVSKPIEWELLVVALRRAFQYRLLNQQVRRLTHIVESVHRCEELIGDSPPMRDLFDQINRIAVADTTTLITGESGTGKELTARALHRKSERRNGPFLAINCSSIPESLLESELFGHTKGAFTDARSDRQGVFVQANGGTLLLDEISDLPLAVQPKLLRALEERRVRPIGGDHDVPFDIRLIAATNCDLETAVAERRFRQDLFYRLNVITLHMPPLRVRGTDVLLIAMPFVTSFAARLGKSVAGISDAAAKLMLAYDWPGNVRELRNAMERAVVLTDFDKIAVENLPETIRNHQRSLPLLATDDPAELVALDEMKRRYILHVLNMVGGNRTQAAQILQVGRGTLYRSLEHAEADDPESGSDPTT